MPRRPAIHIVDPNLEQAVEHLREGTREQYESGWVRVAAGADATFTHELGEIPWMVDVLQSEQSDGRAPIDGNANVTLTKDSSTITLTNGYGADAYFYVRAM